MKRPTLLLMAIGVVLGVMVPMVASAGEPPDKTLLGRWERLDPRPDGAFHEPWKFHRQGDEWVGIRKFQHDPKLDNPTPHQNDLADFRGHEVEDPDCGVGVCPQDVVFAVLGETTLGKLTEDPIVVPTTLAVTESGVLWLIADAVLGDVRISRACAAYRDFDTAVAANPEGEFDCRDFIDEGNNGTVDSVFLPTEVACDDGFDNDGDGFLDGDDPDCA